MEKLTETICQKCLKRDVCNVKMNYMKYCGEYKNENFQDKTSQNRISEIMNSMKELLLYKNEKYGDSALNPQNIFYKGNSTNSILIRLDDKIGRVKSNPDDKPRVNDICDIIGYCTLLLISMDVKEEDIRKFMD